MQLSYPPLEITYGIASCFIIFRMFHHFQKGFAPQFFLKQPSSQNMKVFFSYIIKTLS